MVANDDVCSVTPLKANFWNTAENLHGKELQL